MKKLLPVLLALGLATPVFAQTEVFRIANGSEPESVDPHMISSASSQRVYRALFEGLLIPAEDGTPIPGAAESYTLSGDGLTWTFKMRRGAVWSDGVPVTAFDAAGSWLRALSPRTAAAYPSILMDLIKGARAYNEGAGKASDVAIKAVDKNTFQFITTEPAPYVPAMLIHYGFAIVPLHAIEKWGRDWVKPEHFVCNGPFTLREWKREERLVAAKNPRYWDAGNVKLAQIVFFSSDDPAAAYDMFKNGEADWSANPPPADRMEEAKKSPAYVRAPAAGTYYYEFNVHKKPFNDLRVRKAFSMALDRQELVEKVTRGGEFPAYALTPPLAGRPAFMPPPGLRESAETAVELMAEAGYPDGKGFPAVALLYNAYAHHKAVAAWARQRWERILGVKVELENREFAEYLETRKDGAMGGFDIVRASWVADYSDPFAFLSMFLSGNTGFNDPRWVNTNYDELVRKTASMKAGPERMRLFRDAEDLLTGDAAHVIAPLYWYASENLIELKKWGGWAPNPLDQHALKFVRRK